MVCPVFCNFRLLMEKVKIFTDYNALRLEAQINEWIASTHGSGEGKMVLESVTLSTVGQPSPINPLPDVHYFQLFATVVYRQKKGKKEQH